MLASARAERCDSISVLLTCCLVNCSARSVVLLKVSSTTGFFVKHEQSVTLLDSARDPRPRGPCVVHQRMRSALNAAATRALTVAMSAGRPKLRGVIFDMDGTLTKPNLDFKEMYERCGVPRSQDILEAIARMPPAEAATANAVIDEMEAEGRRTLELFPGAAECCMWLQRHGIKTALVTRNTALTVAHLHQELWPAGLQPFAPTISRDDAGVPPKPDPTALHPWWCRG